MSEIPTSDGLIPHKIPSISKECFTYYKTFGDLKCGATPLVFIHGGPGAGHVCFLPFAELWPRYGIPVVLYDQIGCGKSTLLPETVGDKEFWKEPLFIAELDNLLDYLNLRDSPGFHLLGQSFGGMIAPAFASSRPKGLQKLILASGLASMDLCIQCFKNLRDQMPTEHSNAIAEAGRTGDFESEPYKKAMGHLARYYLCRTETPPPEFIEAWKNASEGTMIKSLVGDSPFFRTGSMLGWTVIPRLHQITAPTLIMNSEFDTSSQDIAQVPFFELIPRVRWYKFEGAGHMPWLETAALREKMMTLIGEFLMPTDWSERKVVDVIV